MVMSVLIFVSCLEVSEETELVVQIATNIADVVQIGVVVGVFYLLRRLERLLLIVDKRQFWSC